MRVDAIRCDAIRIGAYSVHDSFTASCLTRCMADAFDTRPGEHMLIDPEEIRRWVMSHGGEPAIFRDSPDEHATGGELCIDFDGHDEDLEELSWEEFFRIMTENELAFVYREGDEEDASEPEYSFVPRTATDAAAAADEPDDELLEDA